MTNYKSNQLTQVSYEDGIKLIRDYQTTGNIESRNIVVESYTLLAQKAASKFGMTHRETKDDLMHQGIMGIIAAIENFDTDNGARFSTYVYKYIHGYMLNALNSKHNATFSLSTKVHGDDSATSRLDMVEAKEGATDQLEKDEAYNSLYSALTNLSDRDQAVITMYFGLGDTKKFTLQEIADGLKISKMGVQKIVQRSLSTLKNLIG
jgi:RNA polymerase sigma factor (sigma-70 family)